ncbi:MAG: histidine kinase [Clostridium sp.]|nr:histidine kinase [Clostridium sp.]
MLYTILDNIIIIILTLISLPTGKSLELLIVLAGLLMIFTTYEAFNEEKSRALLVMEIIFMTLFAVLSGGFAGFVVFFFLDAGREYMRIILGMCMFFATALLVYRNMTFAMVIVGMLLLAVGFLLLVLINRLMEQMEKRKQRESEKLMASHVSEMHEKRLNEQLVMQNFLAEKNARLVERENISRNIHNSVGHSITAAIMTLDAADVLYDVKPEEARKRMNDANSRIRGSLESIRRAVRVLDEENVEISAVDLKCEMEMIINEFMMDTDIYVDWDFRQLTDDINIPHDHAVFLTGALQELLTNGVKHGNANEFVVFLLGDTAHIRLEVSDNGHSDFRASNSKAKIENGFGIRKIISYVEKCGGKTEFVNENGFKSMVELSY